MYKVCLKVRFSRSRAHGFGGVIKQPRSITTAVCARFCRELHLIHLEYSKECVWLEECSRQCKSSKPEF
jgi:hypothetical protein